jgi:hypothetical protein
MHANEQSKKVPAMHTCQKHGYYPCRRVHELEVNQTPPITTDQLARLFGRSMMVQNVSDNSSNNTYQSIPKVPTSPDMRSFAEQSFTQHAPTKTKPLVTMRDGSLNSDSDFSDTESEISASSSSSSERSSYRQVHPAPIIKNVEQVQAMASSNAPDNNNFEIPPYYYHVIASGSHLGQLCVAMAKKLENARIQIHRGNSAIPIILFFTRNGTQYRIEFSDIADQNLKTYSADHSWRNTDVRMAWTTLQPKPNTMCQTRLISYFRETDALWSAHKDQMVMQTAVRIRDPVGYSLMDYLSDVLPYPDLVNDRNFCSLVMLYGARKGSMLSTGIDVAGRSPAGINYLMVVTADC